MKGNLLDTLINFLNDRKQKVVLICQHAKWANIEAGDPQGSIVSPPLFWIYIYIYINDLPDNLVSNFKLFADDASLFSVIGHKHSSANKLNQDLNTINNWAFR